MGIIPNILKGIFTAGAAATGTGAATGAAARIAGMATRGGILALPGIIVGGVMTAMAEWTKFKAAEDERINFTDKEKLVQDMITQNAKIGAAHGIMHPSMLAPKSSGGVASNPEAALEAFNFFKSQGFSAERAAGMASVLSVEGGAAGFRAINNTPYTDRRGVYHPHGSGAIGIAQELTTNIKSQTPQ